MDSPPYRSYARGMETGCLYGARLFVKKGPGAGGPGSE
jgi:hypothetical protein